MAVYAAPHFSWDEAVNLIAIEAEDPIYSLISWKNWLKRYAHPSLHQANMRAFDTEHDAIQAAISGYGLVLASDVLVSHSVKQGLLKPLFTKQVIYPQEHYYAVCRIGRQRQAAVACLLAWLNEKAVLEKAWREQNV